MERLLERLDILSRLLTQVPEATQVLHDTTERYGGAVIAGGSILRLLETLPGTGLESSAELCRALQHQAALVRGEILRLAREQGATYREITAATGMSRPTIVSLIGRAERTPLNGASANGYKQPAHLPRQHAS